MLRHPKKSVQQALQEEVLGAIVDGVSVRVKPKPDKVMKYVDLALGLLQERRAIRRNRCK